MSIDKLDVYWKSKKFLKVKTVALTPESAKQLQKLGYKCLLETGAGINANFSDKDYKNWS